MSLKVKFDRILGRLREMDDNTPPTPPPDPTEFFAANLTGSNKTWYADTVATESLTVQVELTFNGTPVDADPDTAGLSNWTKQSTGVYTRTVTGSGTIGAMSWRYTPPGDTYGGQTAVRSTSARTLTKAWPAYWGIFPGNDDTQRDITGIVASLNSQHRVQQSISNQVYNVPNNTEQVCWFWIVTRGTATALDASFNVTVINQASSNHEFDSPIDPSLHLDGYNVYVSKNNAAAGLGFGNLKLSIEVTHQP